MKRVLSGSKKKSRKLDPSKPKERTQIIERAVKRALLEYGEAFKRLGSE